MSRYSSRYRRPSDGLFPAYFTRHSADSLGWPFIATLVAVLAIAVVALIVSLTMA